MSDLSPAIDVEKIKKRAGGAVELAKRLSALGKPITHQGVAQWRRVPADRVRDVSEITGFPLSRLRPDVFATRRKGDAK